MRGVVSVTVAFAHIDGHNFSWSCLRTWCSTAVAADTGHTHRLAAELRRRREPVPRLLPRLVTTDNRWTSKTSRSCHRATGRSSRTSASNILRSGGSVCHEDGRRGQPQHGSDISGTPQHAAGQLHGVQCKGKDVLYGAAVTEAELESEVEKALKFKPPLDCWLLATTAPKDASIEEAARRITARHASKGRFSSRSSCCALVWVGERNSLYAAPPFSHRRL